MTHLEIVDSYIKDINYYLHKGLVEGQANGSFGEDLIWHFKIMADCFKEMVSLEDELGIDLVTAVNGAYNGIYYMHPAKESDMGIMKGYIDLSSVDKMERSFIVNDSSCCLLFLDYGKKRRGGWALTKEELE